MKHAYLIIAHNNVNILNILLHLLDDERNDIYLHIDKKSYINIDGIYRPVLSKFYLLSHRINVKWGDFSQIRVELLLLKEAIGNFHYSYYHLLSGADLPIKSQDYIHNFFEKHQGLEFIDFSQEPPEKYIKRVSKYWLFTSWWKSKNPMIFLLKCFIQPIVMLINRKLEVEFKKGANWFSITDKCARYIVENECFVNNRFKNTMCCDEIFLQTIIWNNQELRKKIYNSKNELVGCMREIDWVRGTPYIWRDEDFDDLMNAKGLYARKFSPEYMGIISKIVNVISKQKSK
jgi:hypothetical protein